MPVNEGSAEQSQEREQERGPAVEGSPQSAQNAKHLRLAYSVGQAAGATVSMRPKSGNGYRETPVMGGQGLLDRSVQAQIGRMLREIFSDVAEEPVPERFIKLLGALEAEEKRR